MSVRPAEHYSAAMHSPCVTCRANAGLYQPIGGHTAAADRHNEISRYRDIIVGFVTISQPNKFPWFEPYLWPASPQSPLNHFWTGEGQCLLLLKPCHIVVCKLVHQQLSSRNTDQIHVQLVHKVKDHVYNWARLQLQQ